MAVVEEALRTILVNSSAVAAIVGVRVFPVVIPQGAALPAVAYQRVSAARAHNLNGPAGLTKVRFQVSCIAVTYGSMKSLANAVRQAIDGYQATVSGVVIQAALSENEREQFIGETVKTGAEANMTYTTQMDFFVWHTE